MAGGLRDPRRDLAIVVISQNRSRGPFRTGAPREIFRSRPTRCTARSALNIAENPVFGSLVARAPGFQFFIVRVRKTPARIAGQHTPTIAHVQKRAPICDHPLRLRRRYHDDAAAVDNPTGGTAILYHPRLLNIPGLVSAVDCARHGRAPATNRAMIGECRRLHSPPAPPTVMPQP